MADEERMTPIEAYHAIVDRSGTSRRELSRALGRSPSYLTSSIAQGGVPKLDLFVEIAKAAGYRVFVERDKERMEIVDS